MKLLLASVCLATAVTAFAELQGGQRAQSEQNGASQTDGAARGQAVYSERCAICHYDQSTAQKLGPGLKGIYARGAFANGKKVDDASMTAWIEKGGKDMPPMKGVLTPADLRALISYLRTL
jgi:mono/diheme cytochrome c family protein